MNRKQITWTIPNILSAGRLLAVPVMIVLIWTWMQTAFVVLFIISLITDILDGYLARKLRQATPEGAILDSYADLGLYITAVLALIRFHSYIFSNYPVWITIFLTLYIVNLIIARIKFGRAVAGMHLYSARVAAYIQGIFFAVLFAYGLVPPLFYIAIIAGICTELEGLSIVLWLRRPVLNARSLYHLIKTRKQDE